MTLSRLHRIPERKGQTDRRTDRIAISISRVSVLTRDKNERNQIARAAQMLRWRLKTESTWTVIVYYHYRPRCCR